MWQAEGLEDCQEVKDATDEYKQENDGIGKFIADSLKVIDNHTIASNEMYSNYCIYCEEMGEDISDPKNFKKEMENKGFTQKRTMTGIYWQNVKFQRRIDDPVEKKPDMKQSKII
jgi:putative DNA primase/helicase